MAADTPPVDAGAAAGTGALERGTGGPREIPTAQHCATLRVDGLPQTRCRRVGDFDAPLLVITREGRYRLRLSTEGLRSVVSAARVHVVGSRADCPHGWGGGRATMCKGRR